MTQQEYEKLNQECWEKFQSVDNPRAQRQWFNYAFDRAYALGKQEKDAEKSKGKLMCLRDRTKVCNKCHECDIDTDVWHSMYGR
jgi:hypothetical protein